MQESRTTSSYFNKVVVILNIATALEDLMEIYILAPDCQFTFYLVAAILLFLGVLLFIVGWRYYIHVDPYDSVITNFIPVVINAFQTRSQCNKNQHSIARTHANTLSEFNNREEEELIRLGARPITFLDFAKVINYGKFQDRIVDDVKLLRNALIITILVFPYRFIISQVK